MHEARRGERVIERVATFRFREKMDNARRFLERKAAQKQIVDQTEDRGVQPDPERERNDREQSKPGRFEQLPKRETNIDHHKRALLILCANHRGWIQ